MSPDALRSVERLHAVAAWAATAALVATAWLCTRSGPVRRTARAVGAAAAVLVLAAGALGVTLHDPYRSRLRQRLFLDAPRLGWLFERKQHAAFAAILFAVSALATLLRLGRGGSAEEDRHLRRSAVLAWTASAALALAASVASAVVARRAHF